MLNLTLAEEADLVKRYEPYLSKMVGIYLSKAKFPTSGQRADLMQEARLALLLHIRRIDSEDQIFLCHIHVISAMCRHKERMGLLRIPHKKYEAERQKYTRIGVELLNDIPTEEDDELFVIMLDAFLDTLTASDRVAFTMKLEGYSNREIMRAIGLRVDSQASRLLKALADKYRCFVEAGKEAE